MTALWSSIDANEQAVLACILTCVVGLFIGAAWTWCAVRPDRPRRPIADDHDGQSEYRDAFDRHADEALAVSETPLFDRLAVETLRRELGDGTALRAWLQ